MKRLKGILKGISIGLAVLALVWMMGRYGWRLMGFRFCGGSGIDCIAVSDAQVEISGFYPGSFPSGCVGCISRVEDGVLYLGVRYDPVFGVFETGRFETVIPVNEEIREIYLRTAADDYLLWDRAADPMESSD